MSDQSRHGIKNYHYILFILLVAFLAMIQVVLLRHPLKWDLIDQAYPWRYFIGECLQEGILPLWNPYQLLGSPIHADPQSSAWYPVTWFFGFFFGYNIYIISFDFFLHIFLAGAGMFYLGRKLKFRSETAFFMAVSYMLSGFFIGNAQHFMWIISGTWIPFVLGAFLALKDKPSLAAAVRFALATFMLMTGGYPAFVFLLIYLLLALTILFVIEFYRKRDFTGLRKYLGYITVTAIITVLMASVVLISVVHLQDAITRGSGVTLRQALFGALTPRSMISLILPFATVKEPEFFGTDLSMANAYFGLIPLVFLIASLFIRRIAVINLILAWGLFCLVAAMGEATPLREFLYHNIPGMDMFRFPALFRIYAILSFILVAGTGFESWLNGQEKIKKWLKVSAIGLGLIIGGFVVYASIGDGSKMREFLKSEAWIFSDKSDMSQHIFFQGAIQVILTGLFLFILFKKNLFKHALITVLMVVCFDMILTSRLNGPYTVYYHLYKTKETYVHAKQFPDGFILPGKERIYANTDGGRLTFQILWRNLNIFQKQVSWQGYNPLHLKGFEELADNHPKLFEAILQNPLVYLSGKISPLDSMVIHGQQGDFDPFRVYLAAEDYRKLKSAGLGFSQRDSISIAAFSPVEIKIKSFSESGTLVNLLQNNYHGWKAMMDGQSAGIISGNNGFITVPVPSGQHEVTISYSPKDVRWGFYMTFLMVLGGLAVLGRTLQGL